MIELYIWRHGKANSISPSGRDEDRALSSEGIQDIQRIAAQLDQTKPQIQKILTSPYRRAQETAKLIRTQLDCDPTIQILPDLASGTPTEILIRSLKKEILNLQSLIVVGHMPDLKNLADALLGKDNEDETSLHAGAMMKLELKNIDPPYNSKLIFRYSPTDKF